MPGHEVYGPEERQAILELFDANGGVLFAHGFDAVRNGVYRVREWEAAFAAYFGFPYVQAVSSGTAAIKVALQALGVGPGDEVITQAHTFVATVEAILATGAKPIIVDIDETLNMSPEAAVAAITSRTKAIVPVHMMGEMTDMAPIVAIAQRHHLPIVEDCAQALGASYHGMRAGTLGVAAAFSTDAGKTLSTGEGGLIGLQEFATYERARAFHDHGHSYAPGARGLDPAMVAGFNYRMTELQGALGLAQLQKLESILSAQRKNKATILDALADVQITYRKSPDPSGDIGDSIVMLMSDRQQAGAMATALSEMGVGTKNLPDALRWHFARHWGHMLDDGADRSKPLAITRWGESADILERSVALAVNVRMNDSEVAVLAEKVEKAYRSCN